MKKNSKKAEIPKRKKSAKLDQELAESIGSGFRALRIPAPDMSTLSTFLSGRPSQFLTIVKNKSPVAEARRLHEEALDITQDRLASLSIDLKVSKQESKKFLTELSACTQEIRNFLVREVAVFDIALEAAAAEATSVLEQVTGSTVEKLELQRVKKAVGTMVEMHTVHRMCQILKVAPEVRKLLLERFGAQSEKLPDMSKVLQLLASRKESDGQVRRVEEAPRPRFSARSDGGPRRVPPT